MIDTILLASMLLCFVAGLACGWVLREMAGDE